MKAEALSAVDPELDRWIDGLRPEDIRDAGHHRAIVAAGKAAAEAEQQLRDAVAAARVAGETWEEVGMALGVTRQAAYQRFGRKR